MNCYNSCKKPEQFTNLWDNTQYDHHHHHQQQQHSDFSASIPIIDNIMIDHLSTLEDYDTNNTINHNNNYFFQTTHLETDNLINSEYRTNNVRLINNQDLNSYVIQQNENLNEQNFTGNIINYSMINQQYIIPQFSTNQVDHHPIDLSSNNENMPKSSVELLNHFITNHSSLNTTYGKEEQFDKYSETEYNQKFSGSKRKVSKNKRNLNFSNTSYNCINHKTIKSFLF